MEATNPSTQPAIALLAQVSEAVRTQLSRVIIGQQQMTHLLLAALLADGHVLIEGVPGVAKTLSARLMARLIDTGFSRIQFTPDLMPADVIGTSIFNPQSGSFEFRKGPVFSNLVLIDEINRAPAKTQAALFEVMEERQVTVDGHTLVLPPPFMVVATQNPIEHEGTYRLPDAQLDRFLIKIVMDYPGLEEETEILKRHNGQNAADLLSHISPVVNAAELMAARAQLPGIRVSDKLLQFIAQLVVETRNDPSVYVGASPRASIAILKLSRALAALQDREFVIPEDVLEAAMPVLRHRISLTPEKEMEGLGADEVIRDIINRLEIPR